LTARQNSAGTGAGASGTYGSGDVTIIAGNQITGNYNLADGVGTMIAGVPVQSSQAAILQRPGADAAAYAATLSDLVAAVKLSHNAKGNIGTAPDPSQNAIVFIISGDIECD